MKKTIWMPVALGLAMGTLAGVATVTGLSILIVDVTENSNSIGFYVTLFLLAAAFGGPIAGMLASTMWVLISARFGSPDMQAVITVPTIFWSNVIALGTVVAFVGLSYRAIYERTRMPVRLLPWAATVFAFYLVALPFSLLPQYFFLGDSLSEVPSAVLRAYLTYLPQALFDIFFTSLVFFALPASRTRPLWYEPESSVAGLIH